MTDYIKYLLLIIAYLLGSVPFALIVSKAAKGIDIREYGSKNMGATNDSH
jgi:glycerol-3-phosphate acyltransferase PlsY